ncbi:MAG: type III ribulose-bisphosphate carboxylase [Candidatus Nanoarchaeia archaeon]|nr:type III ribulose-bisphosphate carboxylase [Candidatus Nanoarchaeia archaeon]
MIEYKDFLNLKYTPKKDDLIVLFKIKPSKGFSMKDASSRVASESSNGTWAALFPPEHIKELSAQCYDIKGNYAKIAYPGDLFEQGNMPQILSSIAGNIFGMKAVDGLRIEDVKWPEKIIKSFMHPQFGIEGVRKIMKIKKRPITATVPKPKVGYYAEEHAKIGYDLWLGGVDLLKDDENLSNQKFNPFEKRLRLSMKMREKAEKETGEKKSYLVNITAETDEMVKRAKMAKDYGNEYVMIDILTAGWASVQTVRKKCQDLKLAIHAHRAFHASFDRNPNHGMAMKVLCEIARIQGVDQIHIGGMGKLAGEKEEIKENWTKCSSSSNNETKNMLEQNWFGTKPILGVCSGGLHVGIVERLFNMLGTDIAIQVGGGVLGHPDGVLAGAKALRQSIDAYMSKIPLKEYAEKHKELKTALNSWGYETPI